MADHNIIFLSGQVQWYREKKVKGYNFGTISSRIGLPRFSFTLDNKVHEIDNPIVWLKTTVSYANNKLAPAAQDLLDSMEVGKFIFVNGAKITNWSRVAKDSSGNPVQGAPPQTVFDLESYEDSVSLSDREYPETNMAIISGTVKDLEGPTGKMTLIYHYYTVEKGKKVFKERIIPILYTDTFNPNLIGERAMITGRVCAKRPDKSDGLYVVSDKVIELKKKYVRSH
jgi:hypothetical protein